MKKLKWVVFDPKPPGVGLVYDDGSFLNIDLVHGHCFMVNAKQAAREYGETTKWREFWEKRWSTVIDV